jgi:hypothetical protein
MDLTIMDDKAFDISRIQLLYDFRIGDIPAVDAKGTQQPGENHRQQSYIQDHTDKLAIFQIGGSPYFSYTSGFKTPI